VVQQGDILFEMETDKSVDGGRITRQRARSANWRGITGEPVAVGTVVGGSTAWRSWRRYAGLAGGGLRSTPLARRSARLQGVISQPSRAAVLEAESSLPTWMPMPRWAGCSQRYRRATKIVAIVQPLSKLPKETGADAYRSHRFVALSRSA
jgi:hypothetical protein